MVGLFRSIRPAQVDLGDTFSPAATASMMSSQEYKNEGYEGGFGEEDNDSEIYEMIDDVGVNHRGDMLASPTNEKLIKGKK